MTPGDLIQAMLAKIQAEFYRGVPAKQFFQERPRLIKAISCPAEWMDRRGAEAPVEVYRRILETVIGTIKRHGKRKAIGRFEVYFLHCVQEHMLHHGEEYYQEAKSPRHVSAILPGTIGRIRKRDGVVIGGGGAATRQLAELHKSIKIGGRKRAKSGDSEMDLFGHCNDAATPAQDSKKFLKPLHKRAGGAQTPQIRVGAAANS